MTIYAQDVRNIEGSFLELLYDAPGAKWDKQDFFAQRMKITVPKTNYESMWSRLVERLGRVGAAEAVFDYVLDTATPRLGDLLDEASQGRRTTLRNDDAQVVRVLFWENGNLRRIGELLVDYLQEAGIATAPGGERERAKPTKTTEYDVALSYAGEDKAYVEIVALALKKLGLKFFYAPFEIARLWGQNLIPLLTEVFGKKARYCVMFLSEHYAKKPWPKLEGQSALDRALKEAGYILPVRLDDTEFPGLLGSIHYIDGRTTTPDKVAELIVQKLALQ